MAGGFWTGSVEGEDVGSDGGDGDPEGFGVGSGGGVGGAGNMRVWLAEGSRMRFATWTRLPAP
jgi:hypothetical protein